MVFDEQKQKNTNKPVDVIKEVQEETKQDVIPEKLGIQNGNEVISKDNKDVKNVDDNRINVIEDEIWDQLILANQIEYTQRDLFSIDIINKNNTVAFGIFKKNSHNDNINVFAYRITPNDDWSIEISNIGPTCSSILMLSKGQIDFIKSNIQSNCVDYDQHGNFYEKNIQSLQFC